MELAGIHYPENGAYRSSVDPRVKLTRYQMDQHCYTLNISLLKAVDDIRLIEKEKIIVIRSVIVLITQNSAACKLQVRRLRRLKVVYFST
jgi:hypothetical protein